eukprot:scaffold4622_cov368-Prasinococcus_capsulatus_cf.AAC.4
MEVCTDGRVLGPGQPAMLSVTSHDDGWSDPLAESWASAREADAAGNLEGDPSALHASLGKKGSKSYYYAHEKRVTSELTAPSARPKLLNIGKPVKPQVNLRAADATEHTTLRSMYYYAHQRYHVPGALGCFGRTSAKACHRSESWQRPFVAGGLSKRRLPKLDR